LKPPGNDPLIIEKGIKKKHVPAKSHDPANKKNGEDPMRTRDGTTNKLNPKTCTAYMKTNEAPAPTITA
jgi:hypothetical protein